MTPKNILPLPPAEPAPSAAQATAHRRQITIDSVLTQQHEYWIRGELIDCRSDQQSTLNTSYQTTAHDLIHHMVIRLGINLQKNEIVNAEFSMPKPAFAPYCNTVEKDAQLLIGQKVESGLLKIINQLYGKTKGCTHIVSLLNAMIPTIFQGRAFVHHFPVIENSPPQKRAAALQHIVDKTKNTCHLWSEESPEFQKMKDGSVETLWNRVQRKH